MRASEKLKRLSFWQWRKVIREVVGVVAAAEKLSSWEGQTSQSHNRKALEATDHALAALNEKLP